MLATIAFIAPACEDGAGSLRLEYASRCRDAGIKVFAKVPPFNSYQDMTGNGCNSVCRIELVSGRADHVEIEFDRADYRRRTQQDTHAAMWSALPQKDGKFKVTLSHEPSCLKALERDRAGSASIPDRCILFEEVTEFSSLYSFQERYAKQISGDRVLITAEEILSRSRPESTIAINKYYAFYGSAPGLLLYEDIHCGHAGELMPSRAFVEE